MIVMVVAHFLFGNRQVPRSQSVDRFPVCPQRQSPRTQFVDRASRLSQPPLAHHVFCSVLIAQRRHHATVVMIVGNISLLAPNASVARKCGTRRPTSSQAETSSLLAPNASVARRCCSSKVFSQRNASVTRKYCSLPITNEIPEEIFTSQVGATDQFDWFKEFFAVFITSSLDSYIERLTQKIVPSSPLLTVLVKLWTT